MSVMLVRQIALLQWFSSRSETRYCLPAGCALSRQNDNFVCSESLKVCMCTLISSTNMLLSPALQAEQKPADTLTEWLFVHNVNPPK